MRAEGRGQKEGQRRRGLPLCRGECSPPLSFFLPVAFSPTLNGTQFRSTMLGSTGTRTLAYWISR